jgi:peptidoglycan-associated lipoprotein
MNVACPPFVHFPEDPPMFRSTPHAARRLAAIGIAAFTAAACAHHPPPQVAAAPTPAAKHGTAWEDSVVLDKMHADARAAADRRAALEQQAAADSAALAKLTFFDFNRAALNDSDRTVLDSKIPVLQANPGLVIRIAGNCDDRGSEEYNLALGQQRAAAAKRYLVDHGIDAARIQIISFGLERPLAKGETEAAWAMNRNDEFVVVAGQLQASTNHD